MNTSFGTTERSDFLRDNKSLLSSIRKGRTQSCRGVNAPSPKTYDEALDRSGNYFRSPDFDKELEAELFRNT